MPLVKAGQRYLFLSNQCAHPQIEQDLVRKTRHLLKRGGDGYLKLPPIWMMCQSKCAIATSLLAVKKHLGAIQPRSDFALRDPA
jgi:hypothetical protein